MQLGYLTHVAGHGHPGRVYRAAIELAMAAEELGFSSFWVAQHHFGAFHGVLPSPLVLLAAVAERTSTIRLGTAVVAASLEDPIRLAEDAAVVDGLSGGRLQLGVGAGADAVASREFGRDHERRHADCTAVVDELCRVLARPQLVPAAPGLRQRMWWATGSAAGVGAAAARGMGILSGRPADGPDSGVAADLARYWTRAAGEPRVAVCRIVGEGERPEELLARWQHDPARAWASELVVQTLPTTAGNAVHLATMRAVSSGVATAPDAPMPGGARPNERHSRPVGMGESAVRSGSLAALPPWRVADGQVPQ